MNGPPLRVQVVYPSLPPTMDGGADYVAQLTRALAAKGVEVHVLADRENAESARMEWASLRGVERFDIAAGSAPFRHELERVRALGIDVVHVIYPCPKLPDSYWYPGLATTLGPAVVGTVWNLNLASRRVSLRSKLNAVRFMRRAQVITTHDPEYLTALRAIRLPTLTGIRFIPVGYNLDGGSSAARTGPDARRTRPGDGPPKLVYFGGIDVSRGLEDLLDAMRIVRGRGLDARLVVIGGGEEAKYKANAGGYAYYRSIRDRAVANGLEGAVEWTPHLTDAEVEAVLTSAHAVVLPYRRNSVGRSSVAAAFALGCPTIVATRPGFTGFLSKGENCLTVPRRSPERLADAIEAVCRDPRLAERLGAGASRTSVEALGWDAIADKTLAAYREALDVRGARPKRD